MKKGKNIKKAGILLVIATLIIVGTLSALSFGLFDSNETKEPIQPTPHYPKDHLSIDASYLLKTDETNESVNVSCELFMTNIWEKESGELKATAYVSEKNTNFAVYKSTVEFGIINANSTKELDIPVKFSDNSYKVEILIFESDKLVKKVSLSINIYQNYYYGKGGSLVINEGRTTDDCKIDGQWSIEPGNTNIHSVH